MKFQSLYFLAAAIRLAAAADPGITRCGTAEPNDSHKAELNEAYFAKTNDISSTSVETREVDVYVNVVTSQAKRSRYTRDQVLEQIAVMNSAYAPLGVTFSPVSINFTVNDIWAAAPQESSLEEEMKSSLRGGNYADLNLYFTSDLPNGLLGYCYFPVANPTELDRILDGCVCHADSLPQGSIQDFNLGITAVHEVGHWFGLYHVFQGASCSGRGDYVNDTPMQRLPTNGCPTTQDTCPNSPGVDSIHNYMDYSYDACLDEFTDGQVDRAVSIYGQTRESYKRVSAAPPFGNYSRRSY